MLKLVILILMTLFQSCIEKGESIKITREGSSSDTSSSGNTCNVSVVASQICTGQSVSNVDGSAYCVTSSGTGTVIQSSKICSGLYAFGSEGQLVQGTKNCSNSGLSNPNDGFSPKSISSLAGWYAADYVFGEGVDQPSNSSSVDVWVDLSGNDRNFYAQASSSAPTFQTSNNDLNNMPSVNFDGTNDEMTMPFKGKDILNNVPAATVITVYKANVTDSYGVLLNISIGTSNWTRFWFGRNSAANGNYNVGGRRLDTDGWQHLTTTRNHGTSYEVATLAIDYENAGLKLYLNSALEGQIVDGSFQTPGNTSATDSYLVHLGNAGQGGKELNANVAEILIFNSDLTETDSQTDVECYLAQKYSITLTGVNCP